MGKEKERKDQRERGRNREKRKDQREIGRDGIIENKISTSYSHLAAQLALSISFFMRKIMGKKRTTKMKTARDSEEKSEMEENHHKIIYSIPCFAIFLSYNSSSIKRRSSSNNTPSRVAEGHAAP